MHILALQPNLMSRSAGYATEQHGKIVLLLPYADIGGRSSAVVKSSCISNRGLPGSITGWRTGFGSRQDLERLGLRCCRLLVVFPTAGSHRIVGHP
jgi:hypothetical protein